TKLPLFAVPDDRREKPRFATRPGLMERRRDDQNDGVAVGVKLNVLDVDQTSVSLVIVDQGRTMLVLQREFKLSTVDGRPRSSHVTGFDIVQIRSRVDAGRMHVEGGDDPVAERVAGLVMAAHSGDFDRV